VAEVRVIGAEGNQLGIIPTSIALAKAREAGLDLVEVSPTAVPPVCRIIDYGKYKFEAQKKLKAAKAKQHVIKVKEIKLHPKTSENDYNYRLVQAKEFLEKGFKVRATVVFKGREMVHQEYGGRWLIKLAKDLEGLGLSDGGSHMEGRNMSLIFSPVKVIPVKPKKPEVLGEATSEQIATTITEE
jgi:translation initiation factor IF-3